LKNQLVHGKLSLQLVDEFSLMVADALKDTKLSGKDILRFRLAVETAMIKWLKTIPEGADCTFQSRSRFGRITISVSCVGPRSDPRELGEENEDEFGRLADVSILQTMGLSTGFSYENGINRISFMPPAGLAMQVAPVAFAVILGLAAGLILKKFFPSVALTTNEQVVAPVFDAMLNLLKTIAGPMIFLAVVSGIYSIGDLNVLGKIGKRLMIRYVLMTYLCLLISLVFLLPLVDVSFSGFSGTKETFSSFIGLLLQFIPTDVFSPFLTGNMLQIIFIAICCGIGMLILWRRVSPLCAIVDQMYSVVQLLMEAIGKMIPLFVFVSIFGFILSNNASDMKMFVQPIAVITASFVIIAVLIYGIRIRAKYKIGLLQLFKKLLPTFIIALTTASSAAAFSVNVETCEKRLGIDHELVKFGVPLGQVVYMPLAAIEFLSISMILAREFSVTMTPFWIVTAVFVCGILAIATPPIPGGALSILTVLFLQLGIPAEALAVAISIDLITDYIVTAGDITCLQEELILSAGKMGQLNEDILRK